MNSSSTPLRDSGGEIVWTGGELISLGSADGPSAATALAFDVSEEIWRELAQIPDGGLVSPSAIWTGERVLAWGLDPAAVVPQGEVAPERGFSYDPEADEWEPIAAPPGRVGQLAWNPSEAVALAMCSECGQQHLVVTYDAEIDEWTERAAAPVDTGGPVTLLVHDDGIFLSPNPAGATDVQRVARYDLASDEWEWLPDGPESVVAPARVVEPAVWTGAELIVWPGFDGLVVAQGRDSQPVDVGAIYRP